MSPLAEKLLLKINNKSISVLFIGENSISFQFANSLAKNGFNVAFYADGLLIEPETYSRNGIAITDLVYDMMESDIIFFTKPRVVQKDILQTYLEKIVDILRLITHNNLLLINDIALEATNGINFKEIIKMSVYLDPTAPVIESLIEGNNFFSCEFDSTYKGNWFESLKSSYTDAIEITSALIKGANLI